MPLRGITRFLNRVYRTTANRIAFRNRDGHGRAVRERIEDGRVAPTRARDDKRISECISVYSCLKTYPVSASQDENTQSLLRTQPPRAQDKGPLSENTDYGSLGTLETTSTSVQQTSSPPEADVQTGHVDRRVANVCDSGNQLYRSVLAPRRSTCWCIWCSCRVSALVVPCRFSQISKTNTGR